LREPGNERCQQLPYVERAVDRISRRTPVSPRGVQGPFGASKLMAQMSLAAARELAAAGERADPAAVERSRWMPGSRAASTWSAWSAWQRGPHS
jgi:hypothetical protein